MQRNRSFSTYMVASQGTAALDFSICVEQRTSISRSSLPAMLARARPLVVTFHRGDALDEPQRNAIYRALQRSCVKSASVLIAVSEEIRQALIERLSADPAKIRIVPCGIDPAIFRP